MRISSRFELDRRAFLQKSGKLAVLGGASSYALGLSALSEAAAFSHEDGYKALVCIFLYGGNDHANTLIPFDSVNYSRYSAIRGGGGSEAGGGVAIARAALANTLLRQPASQVLTDDIQFSLAPTMPGLKSMFDMGVMAPVLNVGPLEVPLTRAQYENGDLTSYPRPPKLFSHNDQQATWQSSRQEGAPTGWGGRMADLAYSANTNSMFTAISVTGNAVFMNGQTTIPYRLRDTGAPIIYPLGGTLFGSSLASQTMHDLMHQSHNHILEADYAYANARAVSFGKFVNDSIKSVNLSTPFSNSPLSKQLGMVAKLIAARNQLGVRRQVFFVSQGGYDTHSGLVGKHEGLLADLDASLVSFYNASVELGMADRVTAFTASDFGRTLATNGNGSDHGWGGHHFVIGGAVKGGQFYGVAPKISVDSNDQVGRGRLLPTTSVDEYAATLARWFGVGQSEIASIVPNIGRFAQPDLGFLN